MNIIIDKYITTAKELVTYLNEIETDIMNYFHTDSILQFICLIGAHSLLKASENLIISYSNCYDTVTHSKQ